MTEYSTKYLDYLQAVITRMAANSFLARGWSVTLTVALVGVAADKERGMMALLALFPIAMFWLFDAYFLALERRFRGKFEIAAKNALAGNEATLDMNPGPMTLGFVLNCATRPVILLSHGTIVIADLLFAMILSAR